jgi:DNA recombination protein RmuC
LPVRVTSAPSPQCSPVIPRRKLADNIRQAHENAQDVHVSSQKISNSFKQIERVELSNAPIDLLDVIDDIDEK